MLRKSIYLAELNKIPRKERAVSSAAGASRAQSRTNFAELRSPPEKDAAFSVFGPQNTGLKSQLNCPLAPLWAHLQLV